MERYTLNDLVRVGLVAILDKHKTTKKELAEKIGVNRTTVSLALNVKTGHGVSQDLLTKICKYYGIPEFKVVYEGYKSVGGNELDIINSSDDPEIKALSAMLKALKEQPKFFYKLASEVYELYEESQRGSE